MAASRPSAAIQIKRPPEFEPRKLDGGGAAAAGGTAAAGTGVRDSPDGRKGVFLRAGWNASRQADM